MQPSNEESYLFHTILERGLVETHFQPIVNLKNGEIIGYEALSRGPKDSALASPIALIEMAQQLGRLWELEMLFRQKALESARGLLVGQKMFINVDPNVIKDPKFQTGLTQESLISLGISMKCIVFEITERTAIHDYDSFVNILDHYRKQGYVIAIDDAGAGYAGLKSMTEIRPDYVKIDMDLIRDIDKDAFKQALIRAFVEALVDTSIHLIAEGIETEDELKTLMLLGVQAGQGYYLGRPSPRFDQIISEVRKKLQSYSYLSRNLSDYAQDYHYISHLMDASHNLSTFEADTTCLVVKEYMQKTGRMSVVVTQLGYPIGLVTKASLDEKLAGQFGYALFMNRPIEHVMLASPLVVDAYTPIHIVAKKAMERPDATLYNDVILIQGQRYLGLVSMKKIIEYTLTYERDAAKELNPLSGLPGNPIINRVLSDVIHYTSDVGVLYVDINDFKVYNDVYGFERGDQMILTVSEILKHEVKSRFPYGSFIGHIGGDDFIVLVEGDFERSRFIAHAIVDAFVDRRRMFYDHEHLLQGHLSSEDRFGVVRQFKLAALSVAGFHGDLSYFESIQKFSEQLGYLKKEAKRLREPFVKLQDMTQYIRENMRMCASSRGGL